MANNLTKLSEDELKTLLQKHTELTPFQIENIIETFKENSGTFNLFKAISAMLSKKQK